LNQEARLYYSRCY